MNKYETVIIINNNITQEQKNDVIKRIEKYISENGNITLVKDLGTKKLAYQINKNNYGYYYIIEFESGDSKMEKLKILISFTRSMYLLKILIT